MKKSNDKVWQQLQKRLTRPGQPHVKVGLLSNDDHGNGIGIAEIGAAHEFGTETLPERSWLRKTFEEKEEQLQRFIAELTRKIIAGQLTEEKALELLGLWAVKEVKATITEQRVTPRLEESEAGKRTIERKGSSVTLVDTAQMLNAITHKVEK